MLCATDPEAPSGRQYPILRWDCFDLTEGADGLSTKNMFSNQGQRKCMWAWSQNSDRRRSILLRHAQSRQRALQACGAAKKAASMTYEKMGNALMDRLDALKPVWDQVDHVIIEQQFNKNRKMIFLSAILFSYFMQSGQRDPSSKIAHVKFASSRNKLLVYDGPAIAERTRKGDKDHRKWLAVKHCEWLIREDSEHLNFLHKYPKKKDDLSDCFLQGADYLKNDCRAVRRASKNAAPKFKKTKKTAKKNPKTTTE